MIRIYKYKTKKGVDTRWPTVEKIQHNLDCVQLKMLKLHNGATLKKPSKGDGKDKDIKQFKSLFVANFLTVQEQLLIKDDISH